MLVKEENFKDGSRIRVYDKKHLEKTYDIPIVYSNTAGDDKTVIMVTIGRKYKFVSDGKIEMAFDETYKNHPCRESLLKFTSYIKFEEDRRAYYSK